MEVPYKITKNNSLMTTAGPAIFMKKYSLKNDEIFGTNSVIIILLCAHWA
jgi:hypothetical protein